jgi:hypothetical protein
VNHAPASPVVHARPVRPRSPAIALLCVLLAACGAGTGSPSAGQTGSPTAMAPTTTPTSGGTTTPTTGTAAPSGPAIASVTLTGDAAATPALTNPIVRCQVPTLGGLTITVTTSDAAAPVYVVMTLSPGSISVSLRSGAAATYAERDFAGSGVTGFDAVRGAQIDSALKEVTAAGTRTGTLGAVTSVTGSVACGGQGAGSSTVRLVGTLPEGTIDSLLDPVRVDCNTYAGGRTISAQGVVTIGSTPTMVIVNVIPDQFTVFVVTSPSSHYMTAKGAGVGALTGQTTATVNGDALQAATGSTPAVQVHASGTLTCSS